MHTLMLGDQILFALKRTRPECEVNLDEGICGEEFRWGRRSNKMR